MDLSPGMILDAHDYLELGKGKYVDVDLNILIESVHIAPLAGAWLVETVDSILEKYGIDKKAIKSELYTLK
jgi:hypothetical protein